MRTRLLTSVVATLALMYSSGCSGNQAVQSTAFNCNQPLPPMPYVNQPASYTAGVPVCVDTRGQQVALVKKKKGKAPKGYQYAAPTAYCTDAANHYYLAADPCLAAYQTNYSGYATVPYTGTANLLAAPAYVQDPGYGQVAGYGAGGCPPAVAITPGTPCPPPGVVAAPPPDCRTVYRKGRRPRPAKPNLCPPGVRTVAPVQYQYQCPPAPAPVYTPAPAPVYSAPVYSAPEPYVAPITEPAPVFPTYTPEPVPAPIPEPVAQPVIQPVIQPVVQIPEPTQGPIIQPIIQPIVQTPDPVTGPIIQPVIQPVVQSPPNPEPIIQSLVLKTTTETQTETKPVVQKVEIQTTTSATDPAPITQSLVIKPSTTQTEQAPIVQPVVLQATTQQNVQQPIIQPVVIQPVIQPIIQAPAQQQVMPMVVQAPPPPPPPPMPQWVPPVIQPIIPQYVPPPPVEPTFATVVPPTNSGFEPGVLGAGYCPPDICPVPNPVLCAPGQNLSECFTMSENQILNSPQIYTPNAMAPLPISVPPVNVLPSAAVQQFEAQPTFPPLGGTYVARPEVTMPTPIAPGTASEIDDALDSVLGSPSPTYLK